MLTPVPPSECMRARESVSGRLDGELSELEGAWLDAHLRDCADCSAYAEDVSAAVRLVRAAALERPSREVVPPRRRPVPRFRVASAAAAVAVLTVGTVSSFVLGRMLGLHAPGHAPAQAVASVFRPDTARQPLLAMLRRLEPEDTLRGGRVIPL